MAPGPDGTLFVSIPGGDGSVLQLFDRAGRPRPGWPIAVNDSTSCGLLLPVSDGSVRVVCDATDLTEPDNDVSSVRALAFDAGGLLMAGWPVLLRPTWPTHATGFMVGQELTIVEQQLLTDTPGPDRPSHDVWVTTIAATGAIRSGVKVPRFEDCCVEWAVGPQGVAYGLDHLYTASPSGTTSELLALGVGGVSAGWPVSIDGLVSGPAFGRDGQIAVTVGSIARRTSRVQVVGPDGGTIAVSPELPVETGVVVFADGYDCGQPRPRPPLVAENCTIFVYSQIETAVYALDPSLMVMPGWPLEPAAPLQRRDPELGGDGISCSSLATPTVGPGGTLYLPLHARAPSVGGSLVALLPDGRVHPGWPVELQRPGSAFWSVVVSSDGTVYALAIEPELSDTSSATLLAIAPNSTVIYTTTVVER